jgi:hypothetical protein
MRTLGPQAIIVSACVAFTTLLLYPSHHAQTGEPAEGRLAIIAPDEPVPPESLQQLEVSGLDKDDLPRAIVKCWPRKDVLIIPAQNWAGNPFILFSAKHPGKYLVWMAVGRTSDNYAEAELQVGEPPPPPPPPDAPETSITSGPELETDSKDARFTFVSSIPGSTFECSLDGSAFAACTSPKEYKNLSLGQHSFRVRAVSPQGVTDPTPAGHVWTIKDEPPPPPPPPPNDFIAKVRAALQKVPEEHRGLASQFAGNYAKLAQDAESNQSDWSPAKMQERVAVMHLSGITVAQTKGWQDFWPELATAIKGLGLNNTDTAGYIKVFKDIAEALKS